MLSTFLSTPTSRHPSDATLTSSFTGCWLPLWVSPLQREQSSLRSQAGLMRCFCCRCCCLFTPILCDCLIQCVFCFLFVMCLHAECGPCLGLSTDQVEKQASHCNDKKTLSKRVQELSSELFFGVFVKVCFSTCYHTWKTSVKIFKLIFY